MRKDIRPFKKTDSACFAESFGTIDGFQGQEKDIIILSTVRSGDHLSSIGFLRDVRRMNVALTRAKSSLFIVGNASTLERADDKWRTIVGNARERGFLVKVRKVLTVLQSRRRFDCSSLFWQYQHGMFINPARDVQAPRGQPVVTEPKVLDPSTATRDHKPLPVVGARAADGDMIAGKRPAGKNKPDETSMQLDEGPDVSASKRRQKKRKRQDAGDTSDTGSSSIAKSDGADKSKFTSNKPPKKKSISSAPLDGPPGKIVATAHSREPADVPPAKPASPPRLATPPPPPPPPPRRAPPKGDGLFIKKAKVRIAKSRCRSVMNLLSAFRPSHRTNI